MKNFYVLVMSVLLTGATFVGCSKADVFEENKNIYVQEQKMEYCTNFESKFGKVDANQSWDFTTSTDEVALTRAGETVTCNEIKDPSFYQQYLHNDKSDLKAAIPGAAVKTWNSLLSVNMYPAFCYDSDRSNGYYHMAVNYNGQQSIFHTVKIKNQSWWNSNGTASSEKGKSINTMQLSTASNVSWSFIYTDKKKLSNSKTIITSTIVNYKEVEVNGRIYWCFDCDGSGDYTDLIFMVVDTNPVKPAEKRYMIEDLGSKDDFDFNDIVVDVKQDASGNQKAIVRAMGGTLDFTLQIGQTKWTKSVDGVAAGYLVETMYNTQNCVWDKVLAEFTVTGWNPSTNNITVYVESQSNKNVIIEIPFPKTGEVPMIIAVETFVDWQLERQTLPQNWWVIPEEEEVEE